MPIANSLDQFKLKHGQAAYNTLMQAVEKAGHTRKQPLDNTGLAAWGKKLMNSQQQQQLTKPSRVSRIRGSTDLPLNPDGLTQADERGQQIAAKGGMDMLITSPLQRARNTAIAISRYSGGTPIHVDERAMPWSLGMFEGEPVDNVQKFIAKMANEHPEQKVPGESPTSTRPGESFNDFKNRWIGGLLAPLMEAHVKDPSGKIGIVTHLRDILAAKSWIENGARRDLQFDHHDVNYEARTAKEEKPSSMFKVSPDGDKWKFEDEDPADPKPFSPAIYFIRHGETDWNSLGGNEQS